MKRIALLLFLIIVFACWSRRDDSPMLKVPYLGQTTPSMTPEIFAPGIISTNDSEKCSGFMKGGTVFVFSRMAPDFDWRLKPTYVMELKNGEWTEPSLVPFNDLHPFNFTVAADDRMLYFSSESSPDEPTKILEQSDIWVVEKTAEGWSNPRLLGPSINTRENDESYPSVANDGTVYYMGGGGSTAGLYRSRFEDDGFTEAEKIDELVHADSIAADPYIAPDESYLIYCLDTPGGYGDWDLYVTFQKKDGSWSRPVNMGGEINTSTSDARPYVTPDGKFLFYYSDKTGNGDIYWVDAEVIDRLRPDGL